MGGHPSSQRPRISALAPPVLPTLAGFPAAAGKSPLDLRSPGRSAFPRRGYFLRPVYCHCRRCFSVSPGHWSPLGLAAPSSPHGSVHQGCLLPHGRVSLYPYFCPSTGASGVSESTHPSSSPRPTPGPGAGTCCPCLRPGQAWVWMILGRPSWSLRDSGPPPPCGCEAGWPTLPCSTPARSRSRSPRCSLAL